MGAVFTNPLVTRWFGGFLAGDDAGLHRRGGRLLRRQSPSESDAAASAVGGRRRDRRGHPGRQRRAAALQPRPHGTAARRRRRRTPSSSPRRTRRCSSSCATRAPTFRARTRHFSCFSPTRRAPPRRGALREQGFAVEVKESVGGDQWQARGTKMMVPDEAELMPARRTDALAAREGASTGLACAGRGRISPQHERSPRTQRRTTGHSPRSPTTSSPSPSTARRRAIRSTSSTSANSPTGGCASATTTTPTSQSSPASRTSTASAPI